MYKISLIFRGKYILKSGINQIIIHLQSKLLKIGFKLHDSCSIVESRQRLSKITLWLCDHRCEVTVTWMWSCCGCFEALLWYRIPTTFRSLSVANLRKKCDICGDSTAGRMTKLTQTRPYPIHSFSFLSLFVSLGFF